MGTVMLTPELLPRLRFVPSGEESKVRYQIGGAGFGDPDRAWASQLLADDAMRIRCGDGVVYESWAERRSTGKEHDGRRGETVSTYVKIGFGLPASPAGADHLQGLVAELIWSRLIAEGAFASNENSLIRLHGAKPDPLEPGGDGLAIYLNASGELVFSLWEIKKHDAKKKVSATVTRASKQLSSRGQEYLAKLAGPTTMAEEGSLGELYGRMVEMWLDRDARAGAGVSVGTSAHHAPKSWRSFGSLAKKFPEFADRGRLEALVVAVPDFPSFAREVRDEVWKGL